MFWTSGIQLQGGERNPKFLDGSTVTVHHYTYTELLEMVVDKSYRLTKIDTSYCKFRRQIACQLFVM